MKNHNPLLAALATLMLIVQATITGQAQALPTLEYAPDGSAFRRGEVRSSSKQTRPTSN